MDVLNSLINEIVSIWPQILAVIAVVAAIQASPVWSVLRSINSAILSIWRLISRKPPTFAGKWLAVYRDQVEIVTCTETTLKELTGFIKNECSGRKFKFGGYHLFDELIGHYWPEAENSRDIGTFKMKQDAASPDVLSGLLTLYESSSGETKDSIPYNWYKCPGFWRKLFTGNVKADQSGISGVGLIANRRFAAGDEIGVLALEKEAPQGKHTVFLDGKHFLVKKPWRYINHSHSPNTRVDIRNKQIRLIAMHDIFPQTEITCDYDVLDKNSSEKFVCECPVCRQRRNAPKHSDRTIVFQK